MRSCERVGFHLHQCFFFVFFFGRFFVEYREGTRGG